jgi:hypothetical protein
LGFTRPEMTSGVFLPTAGKTKRGGALLRVVTSGVPPGVCGKATFADLRDVDARGVQAEINWLAKRYAPELARLGEHIGWTATLSWGIVAWNPT